MIFGSDALLPSGPAFEIIARASALASAPRRAFVPMVDGVVCTAEVAGETIRFHADTAENAAAQAIFFDAMSRLDAWLPYSTSEALHRAEIA